jgi:CRISPR-associated protein Cas2
VVSDEVRALITYLSSLKMQLLVVYDIAHDGTRSRVSDICLDFGLDRIQFSVFCGALTQAHRKDLQRKLKQALGKQPGKILLVGVAADDWQGRVEMINLDPDDVNQPKAPPPGWEDDVSDVG